MFVRWINRYTARKDTTHWAAVLVENVWIDRKPVQKHICYLAGITQADATGAKAKRAVFWRRARQMLKGLNGRVTAAEVRKIEAALALRVPRG
jgi:hypothetical protein